LRKRLLDRIKQAPPRERTEVYYEFSVGKYTFSGELAKRWEFVRIPADELVRAAELQKVMPLVVMRNEQGKKWWWYLGRIFRESESMTATQVHEGVLRIQKAEEEMRSRLLAEEARMQVVDVARRPTNGDGEPDAPARRRSSHDAGLDEEVAPPRLAQTATSETVGVR
jgi:hypothetical protein